MRIDRRVCPAFRFLKQDVVKLEKLIVVVKPDQILRVTFQDVGYRFAFVFPEG